ncbi:trimeric intracellular cation channel family protein [Jiulongibacter sp. NS-SX5]|uniref:trimeric intracellular cation channel family protein n=1 Tax=Jiulongibacter sp. NS-SX5 TaxID=3463854 RepID=UPI004059BF3F
MSLVKYGHSCTFAGALRSSMELITVIDYAGTLVFAISGIQAGVERKLDLFGVFILGFVTAVGGGTLRDLLIGSTPVGWMKNELYIYLIILAVPISYVWSSQISQMKKGVFLFDTIGIGIYTILGLQKTLALGLSPLLAVMMGVVSAVFGGVIRDVLSNRTPLIFRKEIYAFACLAGAVLYLICSLFLSSQISMLLSIAVVIFIRIMSIKKRWYLPFRP